MADRVTQIAVEVLQGPATPDARVTQIVLEVLAPASIFFIPTVWVPPNRRVLEVSFDEGGLRKSVGFLFPYTESAKNYVLS